MGVGVATNLQDKLVVDVLLCNVRVEILALDEPEEELVHNLDVRPCNFEHRLVLLGIERISDRVDGGWNRPEEILGEHLDYFRVHAIRDHGPVVGDVVQQLVQGQALDLFGLHVRRCVVKVKDDIALVQLLQEEIFPTLRGHL